jgi:hypothetical protein
VNALKSGVLDNSDQYLDEMIENEKLEKKLGYDRRVLSLMEMKKKNKLIFDAYKGPNEVEKFKKFIAEEQVKVAPPKKKKFRDYLPF